MAPATWRVALDESAYRSLCAGKTVSASIASGAGFVEITLTDIGLVAMLRAVIDGVTDPGRPKGPPDPPQAREFLPESQQPRRRSER